MLYKEAAYILRAELEKEANIMGGLTNIFKAVKTGIKNGIDSAKNTFKINGLADKAQATLKNSNPVGGYSTLIHENEALKPGQTFYSASPLKGGVSTPKPEAPIITTNEGKIQKAVGGVHTTEPTNIGGNQVSTVHNGNPDVKIQNPPVKETNNQAKEPGLWDQTKQWWNKRTNLEKGLMIGGGGALAGLGVSRMLDNNNRG